MANNNAPAGPDLHGDDFSASFNLIGNTSNAILTDNGFNKTGTSAAPLNPMLGPLQNNGGPTDTMALLFGSPALDSGIEDIAFVYDQRGFLRPVDLSSAPNSPDPSGGHDVGAFELSPAVFANISTRLQVETGENVLIGGFIVTTASGKATKNVLLRGLGPALQASGVTDTLADPILELHNSQGLLAVNDNWRDSQPQEIEATTIPPSNDFESAIVRTLAAGPHTAILRGKEGTTGVGLVELYDLEIASPMVANISTRGFVAAGDKVMIGGFILSEINRLSGVDRARILLRGIGPSLAAAGIGQPLADASLELFDGQGLKIVENNNWQETQGAAIAATGAAPLDPLESAILVDLPAGNYTAVLRGANGSIGVGVVEAYNIR